MTRPLLRDHTHMHSKSNLRSLYSLQIWEKKEMGGSAACWGKQDYVASPLRQVNAKAPFQQLHNSSHKALLHNWSGRITVLSRFKDQ